MHPLRYLLGILLLAAPVSLLQAQNSQPNFVVIFADDLGYGDLSSFGHPTIRTPNLDRMAAEGQKWTNFYVAACVCTPSRAALMTGRYPIRNGMCSDNRRVLFPDSAKGLPPSEITVARALKDVGYQTACIGKWHLGHLPPYLPTSHGFNRYYGIPYSNDMSRTDRKTDQLTLAEQENFRAYNVPLMDNEAVIEQPVDQRTITRRYTERAADYIREADPEKPFFLYLAHSLPHIPLFRSAEFKDRSTAGIYGDVIEEIDWSTGEIRRALEEKGVAENTLVVFTSDNGPWLSFGTHGGSAGLLRDGKGSTWEGGMRVPTTFWWPGRLKSGIIHDMGSTLDILPTFLALAGGQLPDDREYDGYDLSPVLFGQGPAPRVEMFYYHGEQLFAIRIGEYKAHFHTRTSYTSQKKAEAHDPPLVFNLNNDPSEKFPIQDQHPEIVEQMRKAFNVHRAGIEPVESQLPPRIGE